MARHVPARPNSSQIRLPPGLFSGIFDNTVNDYTLAASRIVARYNIGNHTGDQSDVN